MTMATSMAFLMGKRISLRSRIIMQEALNQFTISGIVRLTKYIIYTTLIIEGVGAILLALNSYLSTAGALGFSTAYSTPYQPFVMQDSI